MARVRVGYLAIALSLSCGFPDYGFPGHVGGGGSDGGAPPATGGGGAQATTGGQGGTGAGGAPECFTSDDCTDPNEPLCAADIGQCVECLTKADCGPGLNCSLGHTCAPECANDADCVGVGIGGAGQGGGGGTGGTGGAGQGGGGGAGGGTDGPTIVCEPATHACVPCPSGYDACDPDLTNGCETNITSSTQHCGECGHACTFPHAASDCVDSECVLSSCVNGYADCIPDDPGCETAITDETNCGACGISCTNDHGSTQCLGAACVPACDNLFDDCDSNPNNGCETPLTTFTDCGSCSSICDLANATESCATGTCAFTGCLQGFGNCDGSTLNGCETDTDTTNAHCGGCNQPCGPGKFCSGGSCFDSCPPGSGNCDGNSMNGCEADTNNDGLHCGMCPISCTTSQFCATGICTGCAGALRDCDRDGADGCETNSASDPRNCGGCGTKCGSDATCGCSASSCSGGTIYFSEDFSDNSRGWTLGTEWGIGPANASTGQQQGFPDPSLDHSASSDNGIAGINIGGNYTIPIHGYYYMTSPVINLSGASGSVELTYWHWLNCDWDPFTTHTVEVWNGSAWVVLYTSASVGDNLITESSWTKRSHDVTAYKNSQFQIRFGYRTNKKGAFLAWVMSGWNVDDVSLSSQACQ